MANCAASADSNVILIQCWPIAARFTRSFSSFVSVRWRYAEPSRKSDLYFLCSAPASRA